MNTKSKLIAGAGVTLALWLGCLAVGSISRNMNERARVKAVKEAERSNMVFSKMTNALVQMEAVSKSWGTWAVKGRVIQKLPEGLLVQSEGGVVEPEMPEITPAYLKWRKEIREQQKIYAEKLEAAERIPAQPIQIYEGTCLLLNHPFERSKVDGDRVFVDVSYCGQFSYQTVLGARKTVRQFRALDIQ